MTETAHIDIAQIQQFITERFVPEIEPAELAPDFDLVGGGVIDSLRLVQVIAWVSDTFAIEIDRIPIAPDNFRSVQAIHDFVASATQQTV